MEFIVLDRSISLEDFILSFLQAAISSGLLGLIVSGSPLNVAPAIIPLYKLVREIKKLEPYERCIYMQAVTHFKKHKYFTIEEMKGWFPNEGNPRCNMHSDKWHCGKRERDLCLIFKEITIEEALKQLEGKNVIVSKKEDSKTIYRFRY